MTHAATHCRTLQHPATPCNTLHLNPMMDVICAYATHCRTLQHTATHCITLPYTSATTSTSFHGCDACIHDTHWNTLQHPAIPYNTLQHTTAHYIYITSGYDVCIRDTHCNTRQHAATHCNTLHLKNTLQHTTSMCKYAKTRCNILQLSASHCNTLHHTVDILNLQYTTWLLMWSQPISSGVSDDQISNLSSKSRYNGSLFTETCDVTHLYARHDAFMRVTWLIHTCDMINSHWISIVSSSWVSFHRNMPVWHDSFIRVSWLRLVHTCDSTHSRV